MEKAKISLMPFLLKRFNDHGAERNEHKYLQEGKTNVISVRRGSTIADDAAAAAHGDGIGSRSMILRDVSTHCTLPL
jgi:hypothetical protein